MWSVWPEIVEIYLGQSVALLKRGQQAVQVVRYEPDSSLAQRLGNLTQELTDRGCLTQKTKAPKRQTLRVSLSAALCPATSFNPPEGVIRWDELRTFANATVAANPAARVNTNPVPLSCEIDSAGRGIAASLPASMLAELQRWTATQRLRLASVQPLWALASQCQLARSAHVKALVVQEPDAITLVATSNGGQAAAITVVGEFEPNLSQTQTRRWLTSRGLSHDQALELRFTAATHHSHAGLAQAPKVWPQHWTKV